MTGVRIEGLDDLLEKIDDLSKLTKTKAAIRQAAIFLEGKVKEYPKQSSRPNPMLRGNSAKAQRMRAGFFARLQSGEIEVPYRRGLSPGSEKLGQSWNVRTEKQGFRAIIGTNASYAELVQSSAKQTSYHRHTGWITTKQVKLLYGKEAIRQIQQALRNEVES
jgi:phage gpG-like protein